MLGDVSNVEHLMWLIHDQSYKVDSRVMLIARAAAAATLHVVSIPSVVVADVLVWRVVWTVAALVCGACAAHLHAAAAAVASEPPADVAPRCLAGLMLSYHTH
ncbi:hypothetical protein JYU34_008372 [Plutella xylostella]|uniref:Uncharacterized protein n=1 Tax=Plutella xylostella TaxID=51655 RepID=A0ABQ7QM12_PLUXY|nr:hypothetical protein JYU34_008372 [Plutella xylostella]